MKALNNAPFILDEFSVKKTRTLIANSLNQELTYHTKLCPVRVYVTIFRNCKFG